MIPTVRVFDSQSAAQAAAARLSEAGFNRHRILSGPPRIEGVEASTPAPADLEAIVRRALDEDFLAQHQARFCLQNLEAGRSVLTVEAGFGYAQEAIRIMSENGAIAGEVPPVYEPSGAGDGFKRATITPTVRIFDSETDARSAMARLAESGFSDPKVLSGASGGDLEAVVRRAVDNGVLAGHQASFCLRNLKDGRSAVAVSANFGFAQEAIKVMAMCGARTDETPPTVERGNPAPLSDLLGLPTLSRARPTTELASSSWYFSSSFGFGLLSGNAVPLSSLFGLKTLTQPKRDWRTSFGLPLLSSNPAPLSSMLNMRTVKESKGPGSTRLLDNPAPLSSAIGLSTLIKYR